MAIACLGGLHQLKNLTMNQTHDLVGCSLVPQPITLLHALRANTAPYKYKSIICSWARCITNTLIQFNVMFTDQSILNDEAVFLTMGSKDKVWIHMQLQYRPMIITLQTRSTEIFLHSELCENDKSDRINQLTFMF
jgi:hypothetical protein